MNDAKSSLDPNAPEGWWPFAEHSDWVWRLANEAQTALANSVEEHMPELKHDLPGRSPWRAQGGHDDEKLVFSWTAGSPSSMNTFSLLEAERFEQIKPLTSADPTYAELRAIPDLAPHFTSERLLIVTAVRGGAMNMESFTKQLEDWFNHLPLPQAERLNSKRVERALPPPPQLAAERVAAACWVVESSPDVAAQGTAFRLENVGFVTCEHVLRDEDGKLLPGLEVFHPSAPTARFTIRNVRANAALDVAVFQADVPPGANLRQSPRSDLPLHAHVAVCGYPNHRPGDTCTLSPGVVVAHRMARGAVRRLLTNAGIVEGMSGGPAVSDKDEVIGICVTGAPWMQKTRETEDQAIIPLGTLELLDGMGS